MRRTFISILFILISTTLVYADTIWKNVGIDINCREFNCVAVDIEDPKVIYIGTSNGAYKTGDGGINWKRIFTGWQDRKNINYIYLKDGEIFLCTDRGLFVSKDNGKNWISSFGIARSSQIFSVAILNKDAPTIFITTDEGVFKSLKDKSGWERILYKDDNEIENEEEYSNENSKDTLPKVRAMATSFNNPSRIYLGTEDGIFISENKGETFNRFTDEGLLNKESLFLIESPLEDHKLYVVTKRGIFYFQDGWHNLELGDKLKEPRSIAFDPFGKDSVWIATKKGLYKTVDVNTDEERIEVETSDILNYFRGEPSIKEVQEAAIRYAEVYPEKIADWRRRAKMSAILPSLSFGIDRSKSETYVIYTSSTQQYVVEGPEKSSDGWDITLSWDLGDLIWNSDQTLIDVRSKLMEEIRPLNVHAWSLS